MLIRLLELAQHNFEFYVGMGLIPLFGGEAVAATSNKTEAAPKHEGPEQLCFVIDTGRHTCSKLIKYQPCFLWEFESESNCIYFSSAHHLPKWRVKLLYPISSTGVEETTEFDFGLFEDDLEAKNIIRIFKKQH